MLIHACDGKTTAVKKFFDINSRKRDEVSESDSSDDVETPSVKIKKLSSAKGELYCHIIQSYTFTLNMIKECD